MFLIQTSFLFAGRFGAKLLSQRIGESPVPLKPARARLAPQDSITKDCKRTLPVDNDLPSPLFKEAAELPSPALPSAGRQSAGRQSAGRPGHQRLTHQSAISGEQRWTRTSSSTLIGTAFPASNSTGSLRPLNGGSTSPWQSA